MIKIIYNKSIKDIGKEIAKKKEAVPAGGTTSALNGYIGVSLLKLVIEVSKNNFNKKDIEYIENILVEAENKFLNLMEKDIEVYKKNNKTQFENKEKLKDLIEIPLEIFITATELLNLKNKLKGKIKKTVKADYEVALENINTSKKCAETIIKSNYNFFDKNSEFIKEIKNKLDN